MPAVVAKKGEEVFGMSSVGQDRPVFARGEEAGIVATDGERAPGRIELDPAVGRRGDEVATEAGRAIDRVVESVHQVVEHGSPVPVIHGPAIVGIDQAEIPELRSLVRVGDARRGDLEQRLGQRIDQAVVADESLECGEIVEELAVSLAIENAG